MQHVGRRLVELTLHDPVAQMHDRHVHAAQHEAIGGFQAEQAGADDDRVLVLVGGVDHGLGIGDVAIAQHARQIAAGNRRYEWRRTGGDQQAIIGGFVAVFGHHPLAYAVDARDLFAGVQRDAVIAIPIQVVEHDLGHRHLAGQHGRQQNAVVVAIGLGAEHGYVIGLGRQLEQFFQRAHAGHAVTDEDEFLFFHEVLPV